MEFGKQSWSKPQLPLNLNMQYVANRGGTGEGTVRNACQMLNVFPQWPKHKTNKTRQEVRAVGEAETFPEPRSLPDSAWLTDFCGWQQFSQQCHSGNSTDCRVPCVLVEEVSHRLSCCAHCGWPFIFPFPFAVSCLLLAYLCSETCYQIEVQYTQISLPLTCAFVFTLGPGQGSNIK